MWSATPIFSEATGNKQPDAPSSKKLSNLISNSQGNFKNETVTVSTGLAKIQFSKKRKICQILASTEATAKISWPWDQKLVQGGYTRNIYLLISLGYFSLCYSDSDALIQKPIA